jgi:hypothetical protein
MASSIQWANFETALVSWLQAATGVIASQVYFPHQRTPPYEPASGTKAFFSLMITGPDPLGAVDEIRYPFDAGQPAGQEVQQTVVGQREVFVSVQAFTIQETGQGSAKVLLGSARTALPLLGASFEAVGFSFIDSGKVDGVPVLGDMGQGRAHMDVRFRVVDTFVLPTGYIATVGPDVPSGAVNPSGTLS